MPVNPDLRLARKALGESLQPSEALAEALEEVYFRAERADPVPARDQQELKAPVVRASRRLATAGPNAPQMIRLIRHPYALRTARPERKSLIEAAPSRERPDWRADFDAALAERERLRSTSPARGRVHPFAVRPSDAEPIPPLEDDGDSG